MDIDYTDGIVHSLTASFTGAGAIVTENFGFDPKYIKLVNETDRITHEWHEGMTAGTTLKTVAAGTRTLDLVGGDNAINVDGSEVTIAAAAAISAKQYRVLALG